MKAGGKKLGLAIVALAVATIVVTSFSSSNRAGAACTTSAQSGSAAFPVTVTAAQAGTYNLWVNVSSSSSTAQFQTELDGGICVTKGLTGITPSSKWQQVAAGLNMSAAGHTVKLIGDNSGASVSNAMLINTTCTPTGDGTNCATETINTPSPTASTPPPTTTPTPSATPQPSVPTSSSDPLPAGTYNDNDGRITYSAGWLVDSEDHFTTTPGLTATYKFYGTKTEILSTRVSDGGALYVRLDGGPEVLADLRGSFQANTVVYSSSVVSSGVHTITLRTDRHPTAGTSNVNIDQIRVSGQTTGVTPAPTATPVVTSTPRPSPTPTPSPTPAPSIDRQGPTAPSNLISTASFSNSIVLGWGASTDDVAVAGYRVYVGGKAVGVTNQVGYAVQGLNPNTSYDISVGAYDAVGHETRTPVKSFKTKSFCFLWFCW